MPRPRDPEAAARAEVVELLFAYLHRLRVHFETTAQAHDLTPVQAKVMLVLGDPCAMKCLSDSLSCDPSNITGVVDRLEERGLVARSEAPGDRRVKVLQTTAAGRKVRDAFELDLFGNVPGMAELSPLQVADLRASLAALNHGDVAVGAARPILKMQAAPEAGSSEG